MRGAGAVDPRLLRAGGHAGHDVPGQLLLPGRLRGPRPLPGRHRVPQPGPLQQREGGAKTGRALAECAGHIETARFGATAADAQPWARSGLTSMPAASPIGALAWFAEGGGRALAARAESEREREVSIDRAVVLFPSRSLSESERAREAARSLAYRHAPRARERGRGIHRQAYGPDSESE